MTGATETEEVSLTSVISVCACRICQTAKSREELISPCNCKGQFHDHCNHIRKIMLEIINKFLTVRGHGIENLKSLHLPYDRKLMISILEDRKNQTVVKMFWDTQFPTGTLGKVHLSCLERWLNMCGRQYCEICRFQFQAVRKRRYGICQSIRVWIRHPRHGMLLRSDLIVATILTMVTLGLATVCLLGMRYFVTEGLKLGVPALYSQPDKLRCRLEKTEVGDVGEPEDQCRARLLQMWGVPVFFWPGVILMFLTVIVLGYLATLYLMAKDHVLPWYRWWSRCMIISIIVTPTPGREDILEEDEHDHCEERV
ncbi:unnamed protein product [Nezara viridula]|uniref:RING-CH-type domain-containing protein n=1 Tax=Nezara viridula TaxID=85310 RepID=A0A9P0HKI3_NEZVI|nr:unnamed protein product [Nezara viridula]